MIQIVIPNLVIRSLIEVKVVVTSTVHPIVTRIIPIVTSRETIARGIKSRKDSSGGVGHISLFLNKAVSILRELLGATNL